MIKRTLYFGNPAYLSLNNSQLVIKLPEVEGSDVSERFKKEATHTVPIEDLGIIVLDNKRITITQGLIEQLLINNVAILTCSSSHMPIGLMLPMASNSVLVERWRAQLDSSLPLKKQIWQQTVQQKIRNQAALLSNKRGVLVKNMIVWASDVKSGDSDNLEGRAAAYYWKNAFPQIESFKRGQDEDYPNSLLNYGYAILRAIIARALTSTGLIVQLGIHHHNKYNAYCLADDIMEPYRPYVDSVVMDIVDKGERTDGLTKDQKVALLSIPTIEVIIDGKRSPLEVAASTTTASLYRCFAGEQRKVIYPEM